jgi:Flp pilus assembly protein TadG
MLSGIVRDFGGHEGGNYAVIFALASLPLMAGVGASFDYVQASSLESELSRNMDQAALAGIQEWVKGKSKRDVEKTVKAFMLSNLDPKYGDDLKIKVKLPDMNSKQGKSLSVSAKLSYKPLMAPLYAAVSGRPGSHYDYVIQLP